MMETVQSTPRNMKPKLLTNLQKLPETCAIFNSMTNKPIILMAGEVGYYDGVHLGDAVGVTAYNRVHKADAAQIAAMEFGSHFGWHIPAADPDLYREDPKMKKLAQKYESIAWDGKPTPTAAEMEAAFLAKVRKNG